MNTADQLLAQEMALGWESLRKGDNPRAMAHARQASLLAPDSAEVAHLLGVLASRDGRADLALPLLQKALDSGVSENRLRDMAEALVTAGQPEAALAPLGDAVKRFGPAAASLGLMAVAQMACGRYAEARKSALQAISLAPGRMAWDGTLAFCQLMLQQFSDGFRSHSGRAENLLGGSRCPTLQFAGPDDRQLWVRNEQGIGDTLFFLRYAETLVQNGWQLHVQVERKTKTLLRDCELFASVKEELRIPYNGFWINAGDLPLAAIQLGGPEVMPPLRLVPDPQRVEKMRQKLLHAGPAPYIGVTWRAGPRGRKQRAGLRMYDKHVCPEALGKTLSGTGGTVVSLQRLPVEDEQHAFGRGLGRAYADFSALNEKLEDMLALLSLLDEYVSVPNTNIHLRAGLGKGAQVLINHPVQDWRWLADGKFSPWYPYMCIYRQQIDGAWQSALVALKDALA